MTTTENDFFTSTAAAWVADPACYIDGRWQAGTGQTVTKLNPTTGDVLATYAVAGPEQVERAIMAAKRAHEQRAWWGLGPEERHRRLHRLYELLAAHEDDLLSVCVADLGTPTSVARDLQVRGALSNFRWFADAAKSGPDGWFEKALTPDIPEQGIASSSLLVQEPIGVVSCICAYNFPYTIPAWKLGAALATGCPVVIMPSPRTVLSMLALFRVIEQAGFPKGVVNFVIGDAEAGRMLSSHPDVAAVTFTGSPEVGAAVMEQAAKTTKKVVLELGGKSPSLLMPGVDLDAVMPGTVLRLVSNSGQRCGATSRLLVHEDDMPRFTDALAEFVGSLRVGDPRDPETDIGPVVDIAHRDFIAGHVQRAYDAGAQTLARGADAPADLPRGAFSVPLFLGGVAHSAPLFQEEIFGPVGGVVTYSTVEEAVALANDTVFGLNANIVGPTVEALGLARRINAGTVTINGGGRFRPEVPWGGGGHSGVGREAGDYGMREFVHVKHIQWAIG